MNSREASNNTRRDARRAASSRDRRHSVGATTISAPQANALGMSRRAYTRQYGRGETARRVEAAHADDASNHNDSISARPAVYTGEAKKQSVFSRIHLPSIHVPEVSFSTIPVWAIAIVAVAIVVAVVAGPARNFYIAWRDAGVLHGRVAEQVVDDRRLARGVVPEEDHARRPPACHDGAPELVVVSARERGEARVRLLRLLLEHSCVCVLLHSLHLSVCRNSTKSRSSAQSHPL